MNLIKCYDCNKYFLSEKEADVHFAERCTCPYCHGGHYFLKKKYVDKNDYPDLKIDDGW